jgi:hypothetical protein
MENPSQGEPSGAKESQGTPSKALPKSTTQQQKCYTKMSTTLKNMHKENIKSGMSNQSLEK